MKIIDLLNKIANGERVPEKIKFDNEVWFYDNQQKDYITGVQEFTLGETKNLIYCINDEVEILETTITYKQGNYYQYQPYTGEVEIKCNSAKNLLESDEIYNQDNRIEKVNTYVLCDSDFHTKYKDGYSLKATEIIDKAFEEYSYKINEIIDHLNNQ